MQTEYDLIPHGLLRPIKIRWILDQKETALASIKSKSTRKFLANSTDVLKKSQISYTFTPLTKHLYDNWHKYYQEKMLENSFDILADPDWYNRKNSAGIPTFGLFLHQKEKIIGSGIILVNEGQSSIAFKASDRVNLANDRNSSVGALIEYFYINEMINSKIKTITGGKSRNAFGVLNKLGYLDYKLKFGYYPQIEDQSDSTSKFLLNESRFGVSFCHRPQKSDLVMLQISPHSTDAVVDSKRFAGEHFTYQLISID